MASFSRHCRFFPKWLNKYNTPTSYICILLVLCVATLAIFHGSHRHQMLPCPSAFLRVCRAQNVSPPTIHAFPLLFPGSKTLLEKIRPSSDPNYKFVWLPVGTYGHSTSLLLIESYDDSNFRGHVYSILPLRAVISHAP